MVYVPTVAFAFAFAFALALAHALALATNAYVPKDLMGTSSERVRELDFFFEISGLEEFLSRKFREIWAHIPRNRNKKLGDFF